MEEIRRTAPSAEYADDIMALCRELIEAKDSDSFAGCGSPREAASAEEWLAHLAQWADDDACPAGGVLSHTYLAVRLADNRIVGIIDLRHPIDHPILSTWGGHMGYSVRPSERGKGYARKMLRQNLRNCRARGMEKILITCSRGNSASEKTILACGGVFESEICVDGEYIQRYWITLQ